MFFKTATSALAVMVLALSPDAGAAQDTPNPANPDATEVVRLMLHDPAITGFVGPSENAWDFDAPTVPGFGPMPKSEDAR